jgi:hypothetical protein
MVSMLLTFAACDNDFESEFGQSPDERTAVVLNEWKEALVSSEHGWLTHYYPDPELLGGFSYVFKFEEDGDVIMNWSIRDQMDDASYSIKMFEKPLLIFDTYSNFSQMTDPQNGIAGKGFGGELEFAFVNKSVNGDTIFLEERVAGDPMILVKASAQTWEDIKKYPEMSVLLERRSEEIVPFFLNLTVNGWENKVNMVYNSDMQKARLTYTENGQPKLMELPLNFTHEGFEFHHALEFNGVKVRSFKYDEVNNKFDVIGGAEGAFEYEAVCPSEVQGAYDKYFSGSQFGTWSTYISPKMVEAFEGVNPNGSLKGFSYSPYYSESFSVRRINMSFTDDTDFNIDIAQYEKTSENTLVMHFDQYEDSSWGDYTQEQIIQMMSSPAGQSLYNLLFSTKGWTIMPVFTPEYGATCYLVSKEDPEMYIYFGD